VVDTLDPRTCPAALAAIVESTWPLLLHTMSADAQQLTHAAVLTACREALDAMSRVVAKPDTTSSSSSSATSSAGGDISGADEQVVAEFAARQERFRNRVLDAVIQQEVDQVRMPCCTSGVVASSIAC
jgi:hypothetical protein